MDHPRRSAWRFGVPLVCLLAGLLLAATHGVSGGGEIRRCDAPRLVDLVRESQLSVDRLTAQRDALDTRVDTHHGGSPEAGAALAAILTKTSQLAADAGLNPVRGPGLVVTLNDAQRDAEGRFPRDAAPDDLVVHQQDIQAVLNALWSAGAEAVQMQDQRIIATSAPRCVGNTLLLNGRTYSPPYAITAIGDAAAMQAALAAAPLVTLYRQYVVRFGLGYTEEPSTALQLVGHTEPVRTRFAKPAGPLGY
ncbi:MAG: Conserved rane protein [Mycobacterium sp.]|nr:Conserved rane protein [Mycobacterium sp.]